MSLATINSKLDGNKSLFDIQTEFTKFEDATISSRRDIVINPLGQLNRLIGIDKLSAHVLKFLLTEKGTYPNASIGTDINTFTVRKNENSLKTDIIRSLTEYSKQQMAIANKTTDVIGWDVYRTQDPDVTTSWKKINKHLIINNFYYDNNLHTYETYFYSLTPVRRSGQRLSTSTTLGPQLTVSLPTSNTLNAIVGSDFIVVPSYKAVTLYWKKIIPYQAEEILRSMTKISVTYSNIDPRQLNIYLELTNLSRQFTNVSTSTTI